MSMLAILSLGGFGLVCLWGVSLGVRGAFTEAPPYMKGEGQVNRYDSRLNRAA